MESPLEFGFIECLSSAADGGGGRGAQFCRACIADERLVVKIGAAGFNHLSIKMGAVLECSGLIFKIDVDEAKAFGVAESPLKIIQK